jgi:hypothetical protein
LGPDHPNLVVQLAVRVGKYGESGSSMKMDPDPDPITRPRMKKKKTNARYC